MSVCMRFIPLSLKPKSGCGSPQAHAAPLGDKPSHDLKTDHPFDLCHLVLQEQDVTRVMERAAEAYRTLRDLHRDVGILEALVTFDHSMDVPCNLRVLDRQTRDHTNVVVELDNSWRPPDDVLIQHLLTIQIYCTGQGDLLALHPYVHLCTLQALVMVDLYYNALE